MSLIYFRYKPNGVVLSFQDSELESMSRAQDYEQVDEETFDLYRAKADKVKVKVSKPVDPVDAERTIGFSAVKKPSKKVSEELLGVEDKKAVKVPLGAVVKAAKPTKKVVADLIGDDTVAPKVKKTKKGS